MSLDVPVALLEQARRGEVGEEDFLACMRASLPCAWGVVSRLAGEAQGELLRMMASDAMRGALERHFGVRVAFQNCHRVAVFGPEAGEEYRRFASARAQLLNQSPELVNC
jgi:hypothetical protein